MTSEQWFESKVVTADGETTVLSRIAKLVHENGGIQVTSIRPGALADSFELVRLEGMMDTWSLAEDWDNAKVKDVWRMIEGEIVRQQAVQKPVIVVP